MFSGIVEQLGEIISVTPRGRGKTLRIRSALPVSAEAGVGSADREQIGLGDSIAVMGVCLTVEAIEPPHAFTLVAGAETLATTIIGGLSPGDRVHLERALRVGDRLDGHMVQGHVDGVGRVQSMSEDRESWILWLAPPAELMRYIATKGSIAINGVSLTVNEVLGETCRINVVPFTIAETLLGELSTGGSVNIEVDMIARYLERLLVARGGAGEDPGKLSFERLAQLGYRRG
ncbi:MAG: riboflavin synthase [Myxococcota bacterium]|jgi:riboflavin synthase